MARSQAVIKAQIINYISGIPIISQLVVNNSQVAYNNNFIDIVARAINFLEQLMDAYKVDLEDKVSKGAVGSDAWLQDRILRFQYDSVTPQIVEIKSDFSVDYVTVDTTKRIITRASVNTTSNQTVTVKVAKQNPPVALSAPELAALQSYLTNTGDGTYAGRGVGIGFAGTKIVATSNDADEIYINADINYNGQYAATIQADVISAINNYLANIDFNGKVYISNLEIAIKSVTGVVDVLLKDVAIRANTTLFANKTYLVQNQTTIIQSYSLEAGYAIGETTSGQTFTDKLNFITV